MNNQPSQKVEKVPKCSGLFTNYIYKAIPLAFDESLSYYETLCGLLSFLKDTVIPTLNNNADAITNIQKLYIELENYVNNYFKNLDVQEEINNKLDEMVTDGTLEEIIEKYIKESAIFGYDTVEEMLNSGNLIDGSIAQTLGYFEKNDGGQALYKIRTEKETDIIDDAFLIRMKSDISLVAELIYDNNLNLLKLGIDKTGTNDISVKLNIAIQKTNNIFIPTGNYRITNDVTLKPNLTIRGENQTNILVNNTASLILNENASNNYEMNLYNLTFRFNGERTNYGLFLQDLVYSTFDHVIFRSDNGMNSFNGIYLEKSLANCYDNTISYCFFQRSCITLKGATDNFIINNKIWSNNMNCYTIEMIDNCGNNLIKGNHIISNTIANTGGIHSTGEQKILLRVLNNFFDGGVRALSGTTFLNCTINDNVFFNTSRPLEIQQLFASTINNNVFYRKDHEANWADVQITYNHYANIFSNNAHYRENTGTQFYPYSFAETGTITSNTIVSNVSLSLVSEWKSQPSTSRVKYSNCYPASLFPST